MANPLIAYVQSNDVVDAAKHHIVAIVTDNLTKAPADVTVSSMEELKRALRSTSMQVETSKELDALKPGDQIDLTPPPPPGPPDPDPDQVALNAFGLLVNDWNAASALVGVQFESAGYDAPFRAAALDFYQNAPDHLKLSMGVALTRRSTGYVI